MKLAKPSSKNIFTDRSKAVLLFWINLLFLFPVSHIFLSIHCSLVVNGWEMVDLLARLYVKFSFFFFFLLLFHVVSWVKCGTRLYRFLNFAFLLTLYTIIFSNYINQATT